MHNSLGKSTSDYVSLMSYQTALWAWNLVCNLFSPGNYFSIFFSCQNPCYETFPRILALELDLSKFSQIFILIPED